MADRGSHAELIELEPSPVDETPADSKEGYFPSESSSGKGTHILGLSQHSQHSAIWYLHRIQKYSSYIFTAFAAAHITNTSIIPLITQSVPASEPYLLLTRPYYQGIPFEPLLIVVPLWAHVTSGLAIRLIRRNLNAKRYGESEQQGFLTIFTSSFWPAVSGISKLGFQFTPLLIGHTLVQRVIPNQFEGGSSNINLSYVSHAFARHPAMASAGFAALLVVGCLHITWGWAKWLGFTPDQTTSTGPERHLIRKRRWCTINGLAAGLTGLWMAGSFGVLAKGGAASGWVGKQYDELFRIIPLYDLWM